MTGTAAPGAGPDPGPAPERCNLRPRRAYSADVSLLFRVTGYLMDTVDGMSGKYRECCETMVDNVLQEFADLAPETADDFCRIVDKEARWWQCAISFGGAAEDIADGVRALALQHSPKAPDP